MPSSDQKQRWRERWDDTIDTIDRAYQALVNDGMPAEEARGLLPHATATRLNYSTNLRNLLDHSGNRLCTQAQFHWRLVFAKIAQAIQGYPYERAKISYERQTGGHRDDIPISPQDLPNQWQFDELSKIFRPVCYELGKCPFKAGFDRACTIRDRVDAFAEAGIPSSQWDGDHHFTDGTIPHIKPEEWLMNPDAARVRQ